MRFKVAILAVLVLALVAVSPQATFAQDESGGPLGLDEYNETLSDNTGLGGGTATEDTCFFGDGDCGSGTTTVTGGPVTIISGIVNVLLGLLGLLGVILFIYGGFVWIMSSGNTEEVDKAKKILSGTVVGMALILGSYSIMYFIFTSFLEVTF